MQVKPMSGSWLDPVRQLLDSTDTSHSVFFRDDDAGWDTPSLFSLLDAFELRHLPIDLAVIPTELDPALGKNLIARRSHGQVGLHQHGFGHVNHESSGRKHEFGPSRNFDQQIADISRGRDLLTYRLGGAVDPIFTPPWNRCTSHTAAALAQLEFRILSQDNTATVLYQPNLAQLPITLNWQGATSGVRWTAAELAQRICSALGSHSPVGIMLHHAPMTVEDSALLTDLLDLICGHPSLVVLSMIDTCANANHDTRATTKVQ